MSKPLSFPDDSEQYLTLVPRPNLKELGPRFGKRLADVRKELCGGRSRGVLSQIRIRECSQSSFPTERSWSLGTTTSCAFPRPKEGWVDARDDDCALWSSTEPVTEELRRNSPRELVHRSKPAARTWTAEYTDRIVVGIVDRRPRIRSAVIGHSAGNSRPDTCLRAARWDFGRCGTAVHRNRQRTSDAICGGCEKGCVARAIVPGCGEACIFRPR